MFDFRIIVCPDNTEVIDRSVKTPYNSLTAVQMMEYIETESILDYADRQKKKARKEEERKRKIESNPLYRLAYLCGLI